MPGSGDSAVELEDIISMEKAGSVIAISRFIALRGIVTRRELRERFQSGSTRTTITHLKKLGLVYSRQGRNGFVVSIPWLLYLNEIGADWKNVVKAKVPDVNEKELNELEEALREAKRGPLGAFVKQLVKESRYESFYKEQIDNVISVIPEKCMHPKPSQWDSIERYYEECVRPLLQYVWWLLTLIPAIAGYLYKQPPREGIRELAEELTEQAKDLARDAPSLAWEVRLYSKTMYVVAKLLRELERQDIVHPSGVKTLFEHYKRMMKNLRDDDRYNKNTVLRPFIKATIAKLLTSPQSPTK